MLSRSKRPGTDAMKRVLVYLILALLLAIGAAAWYSSVYLWLFVVLAPILVLAAWDLLQSQHTLLRNYPVFGHIRYLLEEFRHQIRQYFIEGDREEVPFSRVQRTVVYSRAKGVDDSIPFGKLINVYEPGYEWLEHSMMPCEPSNEHPRVTVGNAQCRQPYSASRFNVSAMSFGALSSNAILALNLGAKEGGFYHDTGEGGISPYHTRHGGDLVWEIGTGYFGCRTPDGRFDAGLYRDKATGPQVKMVELKLSQGAKPGGGGLLPGAKVTPEIARARGMMFALGCIQARACNRNICPTGVTTHDPWRVHGLSVPDKAPRVARYHKSTIRHLQMVLAACGLTDPAALRPEMLWRRITHLETRNYQQLYRYLEPRELLDGSPGDDWRQWWRQAQPGSFAPAA
jgi:glutamate synthase domain-containing protein 2